MKRLDENPSMFHGRLLKSQEVSGFVFHDLEYQSGVVVDKHVHSTDYVALLLRGTAIEISPGGKRKPSQAELTSFRPPFTQVTPGQKSVRGNGRAHTFFRRRNQEFESIMEPFRYKLGTTRRGEIGLSVP